MQHKMNSANLAQFKWILLVVIFLGLQKYATDVSAQTSLVELQRSAIQSILAEDARLGSERNQAPFNQPIHLAVTEYVEALETINFSAAPPIFHVAFKRHIAAWSSSIAFFKNYPDERGEMHDVFDRIRAIDPQLKPLEKAIWDTWAPIESIARFYQSDVALSRFVFTSNRSGNSEIYVSSLDSAKLINLTENPASDNWPVMSPDGQYLLFQSRRHGQFDLFLRSLSKQNVQRLTHDDAHDYLPGFGPDGKTIYFTSWRHRPGENAQARFYKMGLDSQGQERWTETLPGNSTGVEWFKDGKSGITTISAEKPANDTGAQIYRIDAQGNKIEALTQLPGYNAGATLSPDGKLMAFYSQRDHSARIGLVDLNDPSYSVRWLVTQGYNWQPRFSADGKWLSFSKSLDSDHRNLDVFVIEVANPVVEIPLVESPARDAEFSWFQ